MVKGHLTGCNADGYSLVSVPFLFWIDLETNVDQMILYLFFIIVYTIILYFFLKSVLHLLYKILKGKGSSFVHFGKKKKISEFINYYYYTLKKKFLATIVHSCWALLVLF